MASRAAVSILFLFAVRASAALDITACDQLIPKGQSGILLTDLVCTNEDLNVEQVGVRLEKDATLDLNGHSITVEHRVPVFCHNRCSIISSSATPGVLSGTPAVGRVVWGINLLRGGHIDNVIVQNAQTGINSQKGLVTLHNVTLTDNAPFGLYAYRADVDGIAVSGSDTGIRAVRLRATNVSANNNDIGIDVLRVRGTRTLYGRLEGTGLSVTNNTLHGIRAGTITLLDSNVSGNGIDLIAKRAPKLTNVTCGTSQSIKDGTSFGVCSMD